MLNVSALLQLLTPASNSRVARDKISTIMIQISVNADPPSPRPGSWDSLSSIRASTTTDSRATRSTSCRLRDLSFLVLLQKIVPESNHNWVARSSVVILNDGRAPMADLSQAAVLLYSCGVWRGMTSDVLHVLRTSRQMLYVGVFHFEFKLSCRQHPMRLSFVHQACSLGYSLLGRLH